jgi:ribosomal protein L11 methyltransferase
LNWKEYAVITEGQCVEAVAGILHNLGSGGVSIVPAHSDVGQIIAGTSDIPALPAYGKHDLVTVKAYFPEARDIDAQLQEALYRVEENFHVVCQLLLNEVKEEDWEESWKKYYHCFKVGDRLVVKPSWEEYSPQPGEMVIELDPGMAFGTAVMPPPGFVCISSMSMSGAAKESLTLAVALGFWPSPLPSWGPPGYWPWILMNWR